MILNGKQLAEKLLKQIRKQIIEQQLKLGLAIILVGNDPASKLYIKLKEEACQKCGIEFHKYLLPADSSQEQILETIKFLNTDPEITGILIQLPLPEHYNQEKILAAIALEKDVDCLHPQHIAHVKQKKAQIHSPLARGIAYLIKSTKEDLNDKKIVVFANQPYLFWQIRDLFFKNQVNFINLKTPNWCKVTSQADILIVCLGKPGFIKKSAIKRNSILIDVGTTQRNHQTLGDLNFNTLKQKAKWITPVPGGVGPMTIAMLLDNLICLFQKHKLK